MLRLALLFLVIALIAGAMNFTGIEAGALAVAQILFFVFLVLFVLALLVGVVRGKPTDVV